MELLHAGVEVADAAGGGLLPDHVDDRGDGHAEEGEEEVGDFLTSVRLASSSSPWVFTSSTT